MEKHSLAQREVEWRLDHFEIPATMFERLSRTYPYFKDELLKMEMWYLANPAKHKKNVFRFMVNWLNGVKKEKAAVRVRNDEKEFEKAIKRNELEVAPPPAEWREMMARLKSKTKPLLKDSCF